MRKNILLLIIVAALAAIAIYLIKKNSSGTLKPELSDFALSDTASIDKIFLADKFGNSVLLEKERPGQWTVNKKSKARIDAVNTLLVTIKTIEVRSPVGKAAFNNIMKQMAAKGIKVEIYQNDRLSKTYYVGHETQDQLGTFMYLEGSSVPFVMHIPGFDGFLIPRYNASESEWNVKSIFDFQMSDIAKVISESYESPQTSFVIEKTTDTDFKLSLYPSLAPVRDAEPNKIASYLDLFSFVNYEFVAKGFASEKLDSIKAAGPFMRLAVTDAGNKTRDVKLYRMPRKKNEDELSDMGIKNPLPYDTDRLYIKFENDTTMYAAQYFAIGKLIRRPQDFLLSK